MPKLLIDNDVKESIIAQVEMSEMMQELGINLLTVTKVLHGKQYTSFFDMMNDITEKFMMLASLRIDFEFENGIANICSSNDEFINCGGNVGLYIVQDNILTFIIRAAY